MQFDIALSRPSRGSLESGVLSDTNGLDRRTFLTENETRFSPILWRLVLRLNHSVHDMHDNKGSSQVRG